MIQFRNEYVRTAFHKLPAETQLIWEKTAKSFRMFNQYLHIEDIVLDDGILEVVIRIDEQLYFSQAASDT